MMTPIKGSTRPLQSSRPTQVDEHSDDDMEERPYKTIRRRDRESILPIANDDDDDAYDEQDEEEEHMTVDDEKAV